MTRSSALIQFSFALHLLKHLTGYEPSRYRKKYLKPNQSVLLHSDGVFERFLHVRGGGGRKIYNDKTTKIRISGL